MVQSLQFGARMSIRREPPRLPDELASLIEPQERFEALRRQAQLRAGTGLCDVGFANDRDRPDPAVVQALRDALDDERSLALQHSPDGGATIPRRLVAGQLSRLYRRRFHYRDIVLTPGATAALNIVLRSLRTGRPDDEVVVVTPCRMDYPLYLAQLGLRMVPAPVDPRTLHLDLDRIRGALSPRTRAVVLSQPANPTGIAYGADELRALSGLLQDSVFTEPPLLISDECHRDVRFGHERFTSPAELYPRTCIVHSFGESLGIVGQHVGYVAVSPDMKDGRAYGVLLTRLMRAMGYSTPTTLMQLALPRLLELQPRCGDLEGRRARALAGLRAAGYEVTASDATFFLYPRTPDGDDFAFAECLAERGVIVLPSSLFHHRGHFRLSLAVSDATLDAALKAFAEVRDGSAGASLEARAPFAFESRDEHVATMKEVDQFRIA